MKPISAWILGVLGVAMLTLSVLWWMGEARWGRLQPLPDDQAFMDGTLGLELAPLKYMLALDRISHPAFDRGDGRGWVESFGFIRKARTSASCVSSGAAALPVGFSVAQRLPGSATPEPYLFVGLTCAACHATQIRSADGARTLVVGAGSMSADVIAFSDALTNAISDPGLTGEKILTTYETEVCPSEKKAGMLARKLEALVYDQWLSASRKTFRDNFSKYDLPWQGRVLGDPAAIPTGPSRTRPFRSVVRNALDLPGAGNLAYSKVPLVALQSAKPWSQFDGSIHDPVVRSMIAVFTSGASVVALAEPQIQHNIRAAAAFTLALGESPRLPHLRDVFHSLPVDTDEQLQRGKQIYKTYCSGCHGYPGATGWEHEPDTAFGEISPITASVDGLSVPSQCVTPDLPHPRYPGPLCTDGNRIGFRYSSLLPFALPAKLPGRGALLESQSAALRSGLEDSQAGVRLAEALWWHGAQSALDVTSREFPAGHPLAFAPSEIRLTGGFINAPIPYVWLRAPYLHNASVPTLRQLLGLDPRQIRFCRGDNVYDPTTGGLAAESWDEHAPCPSERPFRFDASLPGNSNQGHWYPWNYEEAQSHRAELEALLAYLRTL